MPKVFITALLIALTCAIPAATEDEDQEYFDCVSGCNKNRDMCIHRCLFRINDKSKKDFNVKDKNYVECANKCLRKSDKCTNKCR